MTTTTSPVRAQGSVWTATGLEPQIFLDHSGRRAGRVRAGGVLAALAAAGWLSALVTGAAGFSTLPAVPSALAQHRPALIHTHSGAPRSVVQLAAAAAERRADRS